MMKNFIISVTSLYLAFKCAYEHLHMIMFNNHLRCMPMSHNGLQVGESVHNNHFFGIF